MLHFLIEGGPTFMFTISACGLVALYWAIKEGIKVFYHKKTENQKIIFILFWGSMAAIIGVLGQMIGLTAAFDAVEAAGDVSFGILMGGLKVTMLCIMYGIIIFIFSAIFWFILKWKIERMQN